MFSRTTENASESVGLPKLGSSHLLTDRVGIRSQLLQYIAKNPNTNNEYWTGHQLPPHAALSISKPNCQSYRLPGRSSMVYMEIFDTLNYLKEIVRILWQVERRREAINPVTLLPDSDLEIETQWLPPTRLKHQLWMSLGATKTTVPQGEQPLK